MESKELSDHLIELAQLDIDAVHAYDQAIAEIEVLEIRDRLTEFKGDHHRHISDLSVFIRGMGGTPPDFKPDFKGFLIQGFTALRSKTGTEGALKAMKGNEQLTNATYDKALSWTLPEDVRRLVEKNRDDERRHLHYIEDCLDQRLWETLKKAG